MKSQQIQEVEFKWAVRSRLDFELFLKNAFRYASFISDPKTLQIKDYYLDTKSRFFGQCRTSCRLRNVQNSWELTLKSQNAMKNGLASRQEKTIQLPHFRNIQTALRNCGKKVLSRVTGFENCEILFEIHNQRTVRKMKLAGGPKMELCFDETLIRRGKQSIPFLEIELELLQGDKKAFGKFIKKMTHSTGIPSAQISKVATALETFHLRTDIPGRKTFSFTHHDSLKFSILQTLKKHLQDIQELEKAVRIGLSTEAVHDFRITLRKLRSVLKLVKDNLKSENRRDIDRIKKIGCRLGRLRDWQMHEQKISELMNKHSARKDAVQNHFQYIAMRKQAAYTALLNELNKGDYRKLLRNLNHLEFNKDKRLSKTLQDSEKGLLHQPARHAYSALKKALLKNASNRDLHLLRIQIKKLRYLCEFFENDGNRRFSKLIEALIVWQEKLGKLQDTEMHMRFLDQYYSHQTPESFPKAKPVLTPLTQGLKKEKDSLRQKLCGRASKMKRLGRLIKRHKN